MVVLVAIQANLEMTWPNQWLATLDSPRPLHPASSNGHESDGPIPGPRYTDRPGLNCGQKLSWGAWATQAPASGLESRNILLWTGHCMEGL